MLVLKSPYINKEFAEKVSPSLTNQWLELPERDKLGLILNFINHDERYKNSIEFLKLSNGSEVILTLLNNPTADLRGRLLLDFEEDLKASVEIGLTVWVETKNDKNALRKLRGIEVKS